MVRVKLVEFEIFPDQPYAATHIGTILSGVQERASELAERFDETDNSFRQLYGDSTVDSWVDMGQDWVRLPSKEIDSPFMCKNKGKF